MSPEDHELNDDDLEPGSRVRTLPMRKGRLGGAVPVRFPAETIDRIKVQAEREGMTVSSWIRRQVDEALADREVRVVSFRPPPEQVRRALRRSMVSRG